LRWQPGATASFGSAGTRRAAAKRIAAAVIGGVLVLARFHAASGGDASPGAGAPDGGLFAPCAGDCAVSVFAGPQVETRLPQIVFGGRVLPSEWAWGQSQLLGGAISRRLLTLWQGAADFELEFGLAKRIGDMHADETWLALYLRWTRFPWERRLVTSIALSIGPSTAVDLPPGARSATVYNFFSPQVTFALPDYPQYQLLFQLHHRSNLGIWNAMDPGWQYLTVGFRYQF
jgi:hypothetical protein